MKVRLYGPKLGQGSFARVTAGMKLGLEACGVLDGYVPIDTLDETTTYEGYNANIGVYVGPPGGVSLLQGMGWHAQRLCLLPPNSTWVPKNTVRILEQYVTGLLAPSTWAQRTLQGATKMPVHLWQHGVSPEFVEMPTFSKAMSDAYDQGEFAVAHFASTPMQRKGTRELIQAWGKLVNEKALGKDPQLYLFVDGSQSDFAKVVTNSMKDPSSVQWCGRWDFTEAQSAIAYQKHHVVAQPSRGEGFGLVPLEARACGVPTMMTSCTGHSDHCLGALDIYTGALEPIDDGPEAMAPSLDPEDITDRLLFMFNNWPTQKAFAQRDAEAVREQWSWPKVTEAWLKTMKGTSP